MSNFKLVAPYCGVSNYDKTFFVYYMNTEENLRREYIFNTDEDAKFLLDSPIYLPNELRKTDDEEVDVAYFIHFTVVDANCGKIGVITAIDDSTPNTLFCVDTEQGETLYIPVAEEFFLSIDESTKTIYMDLPTGLLTLNM